MVPFVGCNGFTLWMKMILIIILKIVTTMMAPKSLLISSLSMWAGFTITMAATATTDSTADTTDGSSSSPYTTSSCTVWWAPKPTREDEETFHEYSNQYSWKDHRYGPHIDENDDDYGTEDDDYDYDTSNYPQFTLYSGIDRAAGLPWGEREIIIPMVDTNWHEHSAWHHHVFQLDKNEIERMKNHSIPESSRLLVLGIATLAKYADQAQDGNLKSTVLLSSSASATTTSAFCESSQPVDPGKLDDRPPLISNNNVLAAGHIQWMTTRDIRMGEELILVPNHGQEKPELPKRRRRQRRPPPPLEWIQTYGICLDALQVKPSTLTTIRTTKSAAIRPGWGAFSRTKISSGHSIIHTPVLPIHRIQLERRERRQRALQEMKPNSPFSIMYDIHVLGYQLLQNYVYGRNNSNMMLLPLAPSVNFINHHENPNAYLRWSNILHDKEIYYADDVRTKSIDVPLMEWFERSLGQEGQYLILELVALRDILPGEEIFLHYGTEWQSAWELHSKHGQDNLEDATDEGGHSNTSSTTIDFRHEIGIPDSLYPPEWLWPGYDGRDPTGDFIASPLTPGMMAPFRWKRSAEVVTPWGFRIGIPPSVRTTLLEYCEVMGIMDLFQDLTVQGHELSTGDEGYLTLDGTKWYLQRPDYFWRSNMHWLSPGEDAAQEHYLQALSIAGFDRVLEGIGRYLDLDGLVAYHLTFIAVSRSTKGYKHHDLLHTGGKAYNVIIPLLLVDETGPELDIQEGIPDDESDCPGCVTGRYRYEYEVAAMMGDGCVHATSACDYRHLKKMRLAATIYVADVNEENVGNILNEYTQEYPPQDRELLLQWSAKHWKKDDPSVSLPEPDGNHILLRNRSNPTAQDA